MMKKAYLEKKNEIEKRLDEFSKLRDKREVFYELCFCLLTPQSNAYRCWDAILELKKRNFFEDEVELIEILNKKTRFHNNKANSLKLMKENFDEIYDNIGKLEKFELRDYLVKNVKGIGFKEASHFLRNIGYRDLAILDRHILKNLVKLEVIKEVPSNLNEKTYFEIENKFRKYGEKVNIDMDELDLLFWSFETGEIFK